MNELNALLKELGWSQRKLARYCEVEPNTACRWCKDRAAPAIVLKHLRLLLHLKKVVNNESIEC